MPIYSLDKVAGDSSVFHGYKHAFKLGAHPSSRVKLIICIYTSDLNTKCLCTKCGHTEEYAKVQCTIHTLKIVQKLCGPQ